MAETGTLHDAFIDELRDTYDAEKQLTKALPKLAKAANDAKLRTAFETHLQETQGQIGRLEQVFQSLDEPVRGKHCDGIAGIIEEGKSVMQEDFDENTMDACLIASGQRAEHYEMAAYGTLVAWAQAMGHTQAAKLLQETLDEEKAADKKLSGLAEGGINQSAADAAQSDDEDGEPATVGATAKEPFDVVFGAAAPVLSATSCSPVNPVSIGRDGNVPVDCPAPCISIPPPPFAPCYQANVVITGIASALGADESLENGRVGNYFGPQTAAGHLRINLTANGLGVPFAAHALSPAANGPSFLGLPAIGFAATNYINANVTPGVLSNYSGVYPHRSTASCTASTNPQSACQ